MDKYEFNIKVEQIRKLVNKGDYGTAMKIADTIDWKKVRNANLLSMISQVYEKNEEYQDAKDILLLAFERAPIGKRLLYKLTELALKEGNVEEAEAYYREFCDLAGDDPRQHLLRFMILKQKDAPVEQLIHSLEGYTAEELDEKWLYELAELYREAGNAEKCVATCDKIMLMFGLGKYVDKAMELKLQYAPLTKYQMDLVENREKYEEKLRAVEQSFQDVTDNEDDYVESKTVTAPETQEQEAVSGTSEAAEIIEEPKTGYNKEVYTKENVQAEVKQAEAEKHLAKEMSRMAAGEYKDEPEEDELGKTRVISDIRRSRQVEEPEKAEEKTEIEEAAEEPELPKMANHLMIEARTPEKGLEIAVATLKQIQKETGIKNPVAKITGSKLNKRGILANAEKLAGKDLMIEEAGDLLPEMIRELEQFMIQDTTGVRIILIDNPRQMEELHAKNPTLASRFECIGADTRSEDTADEPAAEKKAESATPAPEVDNRPVRHIVPVRDNAMRAPEKREDPNPADDEEMDIDEFAQYACKYASEIDCSITGKSMLALYERIEIMEEDGIRLTKANAEALIEEAADRAEKPSLGKRITGIFSSKYNKDGLLILKEEHFI